jgi:hypothetical protein
MAAVTPTSTTLSLGSVKGTLAYFNSVDSGDGWASGIPDIVSVMGTMVGTGSTASTTGLGISYTATSGTIYMFPASENSIVQLLILSGGAY